MTEKTLNPQPETLESSDSEELPQKTENDPTPDVNIRDHLTKKALRFLEEGEYSENEFSSMLEMYDKTMKTFELGNIITGTVLKVTDSAVVVDIGFKSEGIISLSEFSENLDIDIGDTIEVYLDNFENQEGQLVLSKQKADFMKVWDRIKDIYDNNEEVEGQMMRRIKGGIVVNILGVDAFLPGSQIDIRQVRDFDQYISKTSNFKIIKLNKTRRNIVVSRRAVLEEERSKMREKVLAELEIDQVRQGIVKNITDFGAFIDLGGVDGLLHITDMSWGRINHPSKLVSIGDTIDVKVLNFEEGKTRISLGMKQLTPYPWEGVEERYSLDSVINGKVVSITDYGIFVELEHGIEGLVHISEMSWTQPTRHPSKLFSIGDEIECKVLNVDKTGEKISLGIKQLEPDPWATINERHPIGSRVQGKVRNLTNFGAFVEIEEGIDGLVHISDMSWTKRIKHPSEIMKRGQVVEVEILDINKENRRISLGHKQIFEDPWETLEVRFAVGMITKGIIIRILDRGVVVALENDIEGFVPSFQLGEDIKKPVDAFSIDDEIPLKVVEFDKDQRKIILSVREYFEERDRAELEEFMAKHKPKPVTIGDTVGEALETPSEKEASETETAVKETAEPSGEIEPAAEPVEETQDAPSDSEVSPEDTVPVETVSEEAEGVPDESDSALIPEAEAEEKEEIETTDTEEDVSIETPDDKIDSPEDVAGEKDEESPEDTVPVETVSEEAEGVPDESDSALIPEAEAEEKEEVGTTDTEEDVSIETPDDKVDSPEDVTEDKDVVSSEDADLVDSETGQVEKTK
ncbi:30S ribosomal protein S1 [Candidatus Latescibacterota bacterium]